MPPFGSIEELAGRLQLLSLPAESRGFSIATRFPQARGFDTPELTEVKALLNQLA